jgi:hypothetical protein
MEGRNAFAVMVVRAGTITASVLLLIGLAGCALLGRKSLVEPGALQGRIENNIYISPQESFRIRIPWLAADATVSDETSADNSVNVTIADNLCRVFTVSQRPGFLGTQSLESWVDTHIVADLKRLNFAVRSEPLMTRNGLAISLRYRAPAAGPCGQTLEVDGKKVVSKRDADVGWHIYHRDGRFYRLIYVVGIGPGAPEVWYVNRLPVDDVLRQFAEGFEILGARDK